MTVMINRKPDHEPEPTLGDLVRHSEHECVGRLGNLAEHWVWSLQAGPRWHEHYGTSMAVQPCEVSGRTYVGQHPDVRYTYVIMQ